MIHCSLNFTLIFTNTFSFFSRFDINEQSHPISTLHRFLFSITSSLITSVFLANSPADMPDSKPYGVALVVERIIYFNKVLSIS